MKTITTKLILTLLVLVAFTTSAVANVAGTATASSGDATLAIDGNDGSRWESEHGVDPQWLLLSLDEVQTLGGIKIHWEAANAKSYTVSTSTDNATWTEVYTTTTGESADRWDDITFSSVEAQYIKITGTERNLTYGYSIWEVELVEAVLPAQDATLSDIQVDGVTIDNFTPSTTDYTVSVAPGTTTVPTVTSTLTQSAAQQVVTAATEIPGTTTITVTSSDASTTKTYTLQFIEQLTPVNLPISFEDENTDYDLVDFEGASTVMGTDPTDANNSVAITTKTTGSPMWAGTTMGLNGFADVVPLSTTNSTMTARVYSPKAGIAVRLKGEDANDVTLTVETDAFTTVANAWETLVFDFNNVGEGTNPFNPNTNFNKFSIFFDYGNDGDNSVYYWDDVAFGSAPSAITNPTDNAALSIYPNPTTGIISVDAVDGTSVAVYSVAGQVLLQSTLYQGQISLTNLQNGVYFVKVGDQMNRVIKK